MTSTTEIPTVTPIVLEYDDLVAFPTADEAKRATLISQLGQAFGPDGVGLLAVAHVPDFAEKRLRLLTLAREVPTLPDLHTCELPEASYSTGWSHGREQLAPNKPDTAKGSFYANPFVDSLVETLAAADGRHEYWDQQRRDCPAFYADNVWPASLPKLRTAFFDLGQCLTKTGGFLARVCDAYCAAHGVTTELHKTLTTSQNAKGRLLHYFDTTAANDKDKNDGDTDDMWCGWHNDHGSLTCLAPGLFLDKDGQPLSKAPAGSGLLAQSRSGQVVRVGTPQMADGSVCALFQIGETSQIQSGGLLQATPHAVQTAAVPGVTRESFAVFMEPVFEASLAIPPGRTLDQCQANNVVLPPSVRPLRERWQPGQTFGDFHVATITAFATD